ncbi:MAG: Asp-tRNA(Asn)/Glu-tRNA(Gln) amidotransferase subunit GatC [Ilumatobacter sp.]|nr:Asp-tRNA(Asn)/Glu-tRNA(Gln) amidotransferase subunit GatC [Ilumatobacter sp.]
MSDRLTRDDVAKVAYLARLDLTPDEIERATTQLDDMLGHFADIDALELGDVEPMTQPYHLVNVMRGDDEEPCLDRDTVLAQAPRSEDGQFLVPPITGGEG